MPVDDLSELLELRAPDIELYHRYYIGEQRIAFETSKWRETFGNLFAELSDSWCQIVVDSASERLKVEGFRFGPSSEGSDDEAWALWQANYLDADSRLAHTESCKTGIAYLLVLPSDDPDTPQITVESPLQCITRSDPQNRRKRLEGMKTWLDDDGETARATWFTPDAFVRYVQRKDSSRWTADGPAIRNKLGIVPLIPMLNTPTTLGEGVSDLTVVVPLQDVVNKLLSDQVINSEYIAFPQRYATGIELPKDPATGRTMDREQFLSSVARLWVAEDKDVEFGEFKSSDPTGNITLIETVIQHIAAITRVPPHYLTAGLGQWPSGESLKATEVGLVKKVQHKQLTFGEAWEEAMRLAFLFRGDELRGAAAAAETIWADPETRTQGELVDALLKLRTLGVPLEYLWEKYGASQQQIKDWLEQRRLTVPREEDQPPGPGQASAEETASGTPPPSEVRSPTSR